MSQVYSIARAPESKNRENSDVLHNIEAEQALIGILLLNNKLFEQLPDYFGEKYFYYPLHSELFSVIARIVDRGQVADPITLKPLLQDNDLLKADGGINYLIDIAANVPTTININDYAAVIRECYLRRNLTNIGDKMVRDAGENAAEKTAQECIESAEKELYDLAVKEDSGSSVKPFSQALTEAVNLAEIAFKSDSSIVGVTTGFIDVDKWLGGLHPSDLVIIAGRPSSGKTALGTNIAFNAARALASNPKDGANVAFFSLEMSAEQLATRILSGQTEISSDRIRRGDIATSDFPKIVEASREIESIGLFIDDTPALSITALRNRARRLKRQHNIGLIIIDYLQLMAGSAKTAKSDNRVQEISDISRGLKAIAKELHVPIVALSQLSRAVEQREDKRPQLSDLRESGSIEQDADVVIFVYRDEYYESRKEPPLGTDKHAEWQQRMASVMNKAELIIAKQRHGPVGTVRLFFEGKFTRFGNLQS